jgi:tetratricopeptide (TPR) repeat protein
MVGLARRAAGESIEAGIISRIREETGAAAGRLCLWILAALIAAAALLAFPRTARAQDKPKAEVTIRTIGPRTTVRKTPAKPARTRVAGTRSVKRGTAARSTRVPPGKRVARAPAPKRAETAVTLNNRAYRMQRIGRHRAAEPLLREALRQRPGYAYALYNLGWSLVEQGRAREAVDPLRRTAALQPNRWEPQQRLAEAYRLLGRESDAAAAARRARELRFGRRSTSRAAPRDRAEAPAPRTAITARAWLGSTSRAEERLRALTEPAEDGTR